MPTTQYAMRIKMDGGNEAVLEVKKPGEAAEQSAVKVESSLNKSGAAIDRVAAKHKRMADAIKADLDPVHAAMVQTNADLERYNTLIEKGFLSAADGQAASKRAVDRYNEMASHHNNPANDDGISDKQKRAGRLNMVRQGADVFTTGMMGMDLGMIAIQQGPQILDAMAMSGVKLTAVMGIVAAAIAAVAGAVLVIGGNVMRNAEDIKAYTTALAVNADGLKYSAAQMAIVSRELDVAGVSVKNARAELKIFLAEGVDSTRLKEFGETSLAVSKVLGEDVVSSAQKVGKAFTGNYADVKALDDSLNFLTATEREHIKTLFESGQAGEARNEAFRIFSEKYGKAYNESLTEADRLTRTLSGAWDNLVQTLSNTAMVEGATSVIGQQIEKLDQWLKQYVRIRDLTKEDKLQAAANLSMRGLDEARDYTDALSAYNDAKRKGASEKTLYGLEQMAKGAADKVKKTQDQLREATGDFRTGSTDTVGADSERGAKHYSDLLDNGSSKDDRVTKLRAERAEIEAGIKVYGKEAEAKARIAGIDKEIAEIQKPKGQGRTQALAREAEATRVSTEQALLLSDAYLKGDAAAMKAEAARKALTEATRKGTDAGAAEQRQIALVVAEQAASTAKQINGLRQSAAVRATANAAIMAGNIPAQKAADLMALEEAKRPILIALELADGEAKKRLLANLEALNGAMAESNRQRDLGSMLAQNAATEDQIALMQKQIELMGLSNEAQAVALAQYRAKLAVERSSLNLSDPKDKAIADASVAGAGTAAQTQADLSRAQYFKQSALDHADAMEYAQRELELAGASETVRDRELAILKARQDVLRQTGGVMTSEAKIVLENVEAEERLNEKVQRRIAYHEEITAVQVEGFRGITDLIKKGDTDWDDWKDAGLKALQAIIVKSMELSLLNPFQNWAFGSNLPTTADSGGSGGALMNFISSLFGGGKSTSGSSILQEAMHTSSKAVPYANGTPYHPGGLARVNDGTGDEIIDLPEGSRVFSASQSRDIIRNMQAQAAPVNEVHQHFYMNGAVVTDDIITRAEKAGRNAAGAAVPYTVKLANQSTPATLAEWQNDKG